MPSRLRPAIRGFLATPTLELVAGAVWLQAASPGFKTQNVQETLPASAPSAMAYGATALNLPVSGVNTATAASVTRAHIICTAKPFEHVMDSMPAATARSARLYCTSRPMETSR